VSACHPFCALFCTLRSLLNILAEGDKDKVAAEEEDRQLAVGKPLAEEGMAGGDMAEVDKRLAVGRAEEDMAEVDRLAVDRQLAVGTSLAVQRPGVELVEELVWWLWPW